MNNENNCRITIEIFVKGNKYMYETSDYSVGEVYMRKFAMERFGLEYEEVNITYFNTNGSHRNSARSVNAIIEIPHTTFVSTLLKNMELYMQDIYEWYKENILYDTKVSLTATDSSGQQISMEI